MKRNIVIRPEKHRDFKDIVALIEEIRDAG